MPTAVPPAYPLATCHRVELFAEGIFRGREYTADDVAEMVRNFYRLGPRGLNLLNPPLVIGHEEPLSEFLERSDIPAAGVVSGLHRRGNKLVADFVDVPADIAKLIAARAYRTVSIEHYDDSMPFELPDGTKFPGKVLRRVALLGGEVPQVKSLKGITPPVWQYGERVADLRPVRWARTRSGTSLCFSEVRPMHTLPQSAPKPMPTTRLADNPDRQAWEEQFLTALPGFDKTKMGLISDELMSALLTAMTGGQDAESQAIEKYCEANAHVFTRYKKDPRSFCHTFAELKRKNPKARASMLIGEQSARQYGGT
jgi:hypothetical protein